MAKVDFFIHCFNITTNKLKEKKRPSEPKSAKHNGAKKDGIYSIPTPFELFLGILAKKRKTEKKR
jgi:hypothetical protein